MKLFCGSSHESLGEGIASELGISLGRLHREVFPDGELFVVVEETVVDEQVFVLQSVVREPNLYLMELLILIDALKRASAREITAVIPYYGYARQSRSDRSGEPVTAKLVANMLQVAGATRLMTMDLHAGQIQGFFDIPVDHLHARPLLWESLERQGLDDPVFVAPDKGRVPMASAFAAECGATLAVIDKRRLSATEVSVENFAGDVKGRTVVIVDDMVSTGGTLFAAAEACVAGGASRILAVVTHALFVGDALQKLEASPIEKVLVTDSVPMPWEHPKVEVTSIAGVFSKEIEKHSR